jgi:hypothetical protein
MISSACGKTMVKELFATQNIYYLVINFTAFVDIFNYEKPPSNNPYFDDESLGMTCPCLPECHRVDYSIEITSNILACVEAINLNYLINFNQQTFFN